MAVAKLPILDIPVPAFVEQGGATMWVLVACSLVALAIVLERMFFWLIEIVRRNAELPERMLERAQAKDFNGAQALAAGSKDFVVRLLAYGLSHRAASVSDSLELAAAEQLKRMKRFLPVLDTIITVAPLLGILGTVIGIIDAFQVLEDAAIQEPRAVVGGIAKALVTTVAGLIISIGSLVPYNFFISRVEAAAGEMNHRGTQLEMLIKKGAQSDAG